jgi:integrase/recombinase XerC
MTNISEITNYFFNYLEYEKRYSPHTLLSYKTDLNQFQDYLTATYETENPATASYQMIRSWIASQIECGISEKSVNRKIACLRSFFKFLIISEIIEKSPMQKVQALKTRKSLPVFAEETHLHKILDHFTYPAGFSGLRDKLLIELLYGTGIRLSELINLKNKDVNTLSSTIKVTGKGNKERIIPLNKSLSELINVYIAAKAAEIAEQTENFIVTDKGQQTYPVFIYRTIKKYLEMIPTLEKRSPHVLRHTFATHLLNKGADLNAIKDLLGHSSLAATQVYTHNTLDKIKAIFDQAHPKA